MKKRRPAARLPPEMNAKRAPVQGNQNYAKGEGTAGEKIAPRAVATRKLRELATLEKAGL